MSLRKTVCPTQKKNRYTKWSSEDDSWPVNESSDSRSRLPVNMYLIRISSRSALVGKLKLRRLAFLQKFGRWQCLHTQFKFAGHDINLNIASYDVKRGCIRGWSHREISAWVEISAGLLTYEKEKNNLKKKHEIKYEAFFFKLSTPFQYVNSLAEIPSWLKFLHIISPLSPFSTRRVFSREQGKIECDWLVMSSVFVASQSSCCFLCSREQIRVVENRL